MKTTQHWGEGRGELYSREDSRCRKAGKMELERGPRPMGWVQIPCSFARSALQKVVLLMQLPQVIHFATCRAGFVADCQLVLTTRSYSSLHAWRVWNRYQRWCLTKYKTKGVCSSRKEGCSISVWMSYMSVLSLKLFFTYPPFPLVFQPALISDLAPGLPEIWRCWEIHLAYSPVKASI